MGFYRKIGELWKQPRKTMGADYRHRLVKWRREAATVRIERPTRLDRARSLGYKAKEGIVVVRQRVMRGGHRKPRPKGGRRPKRFGTRKNLKISYQVIAEQRAAGKYPNMEVLNSYWVAEDNNYYWYEIILVDPLHPVVLSDKVLNWIGERQHTRRVYRSKTSAARKSRGLLNKGRGAEKLRPSLAAHGRRGK